MKIIKNGFDKLVGKTFKCLLCRTKFEFEEQDKYQVRVGHKARFMFVAKILAIPCPCCKKDVEIQ